MTRRAEFPNLGKHTRLRKGRTAALSVHAAFESLVVGAERWRAFEVQSVAGSGNVKHEGDKMHVYHAVIERDAQTGLYVGYVPGWPGAHSQGETMDELRTNIEEVVAMLLEDGARSA